MHEETWISSWVARYNVIFIFYFFIFYFAQKKSYPHAQKYHFFKLLKLISFFLPKSPKRKQRSRFSNGNIATPIQLSQAIFRDILRWSGLLSRSSPEQMKIQKVTTCYNWSLKDEAKTYVKRNSLHYPIYYLFFNCYNVIKNFPFRFLYFFLSLAKFFFCFVSMLGDDRWMHVAWNPTCKS